MTTLYTRSVPSIGHDFRAVRMNGRRADIVEHLCTTCKMPKEEAERLVPKGTEMPTESRTALTPEQLDVYNAAVRRETPDPAIRTILLLLPLCGLRVSEICGLRKGHVVKEDGKIGLRFKGKGQKERFVPLTRGARKLLAEYFYEKRTRTAGSFLFPNFYGTGPISPKWIQEECRYLQEVEPSLEGLTPHVLRHTYASLALWACANMRELQANLGHGTVRSKGKLPKVMLTYLHT
jgi:integrase/recombinase XerC